MQRRPAAPNARNASGASDLPVDKQRLLALARKRLDVFTRMAFNVVEGKALAFEPYVESLCFELQEMLEGRCSRLLINMPPRHLKSFSVAIALPAFALGHRPDLDIVVATYNQELGRDHTEAFLRLMASPFYRACFPGTCLSETRVENVRTDAGGGRRPVTVGGAFTGLGADILVLDDLIKAQDVEHGPLREEVLRFYRETAVTRLNDQRTGRVIVAQQRLHPYDISADLIESGVYRHLSLSSIAQQDQKLRLYGDRIAILKAGELLSPRRFPQDVLDNLRLEMGAAAFSAQFLQNPLPSGSMLIDIQRLGWVEAPCARAGVQYVVQSIDTAVTISDRSDYSVIMTFGWNGEHWFILNILRERLDFSALKQVVIEQGRSWNADLTLIEGSHIGSALWTEVHSAIRRGLTITPHGSKEERLAASTEALYSGDVAIPRNETWSNLLRDELRAFPGGRHDDMVDALTQFVGWERDMNIRRLVDRKHGRRLSTGRPSMYW